MPCGFLWCLGVGGGQGVQIKSIGDEWRLLFSFLELGSFAAGVQLHLKDKVGWDGKKAQLPASEVLGMATVRGTLG